MRAGRAFALGELPEPGVAALPRVGGLHVGGAPVGRQRQRAQPQGRAPEHGRVQVEPVGVHRAVVEVGLPRHVDVRADRRGAAVA